MRADSAQEQWEGFWCLGDERYYTRCVRADGGEQWYRIDDTRSAKVLPFRRTLTQDVRRTVMLGRYGQRCILVRTSRSARRTRGAR